MKVIIDGTTVEKDNSSDTEDILVDVEHTLRSMLTNFGINLPKLTDDERRSYFVDNGVLYEKFIDRNISMRVTADEKVIDIFTTTMKLITLLNGKE